MTEKEKNDMNIFIPANTLESAIVNGDIFDIIVAIVEGGELQNLAALKLLGNTNFPDEVVFAILFLTVPRKKLKRLSTSGQLYRHMLPEPAARLKQMVEEVLSPEAYEPSEQEQQLIAAIFWRKNEEIIRLIEKEKVKFRIFDADLLIMLGELSREAKLVLLRDGFTARIKAAVFGLLFYEVETPDVLNSYSYESRVKYANLMIRIMQGDNVSHHEAWYPETPYCGQDYCFDPEHRFEPFSVKNTMLVNSKKLRELNPELSDDADDEWK